LSIRGLNSSSGSHSTFGKGPTTASNQLRQPRLAQVIASVLRSRIVKGQLADGDALPRQEDLLREFGVGKPALREALRILESEGLISVRRGNRGGAIVHVPRVANAAYTFGLVLQSQSVRLADLSEALKRIEPVCAGLCAARDDRHTAVLPRLRELHEQIIDNLDDEVAFTRLSRHFHEELVASCGNQTMILVIGALESLWSRQEVDWASRARAAKVFPEREQRRAGVRAHERILQLIERGDVAGVERQVRIHLDASLLYALDTDEQEIVRPGDLPDGAPPA